MKIKNLFSSCIMICGVMALASCISEGTENTQEGMNSDAKQMTFLAEYDNGDISSRTYLYNGDSDKPNQVFWSGGDKISLFDNADRHEFTLSTGAGTKSGGFSGQASYNTKTYYAVYPYSESQVRDGNTIKNVKIPNVQHAIPGTFDPEANVMTAVATADNKELHFKNVCSYAKIQTTQNCKEITLVTYKTHGLSGNFDLTLDENGIVTAATLSEVQEDKLKPYTVHLVPAEGEAYIEKNKIYYIALIAGDLPNIRAEFTGMDGDITYRAINQPITLFKRGKIINFGLAPDSWMTICPEDPSVGTTPHPHAIDLGLPSGTLWSCSNVDENESIDKPGNWGTFYAWGETDVKANENDYTWKLYKWAGNEKKRSLTKYCDNPEWGLNEFVDNLSELLPEDDVACVKWKDKGKWRIPTIAMWQELMDECDWEWTCWNDKNGFFVKSRVNKNMIFIPASGFCFDDTSEPNNGYLARYRSRSLVINDPGQAWGFNFDEAKTPFLNYQSRYGGRTVRPVWDENLEDDGEGHWIIATP